MKKKISILILALCIICHASSHAEKNPEWITGTLCFKTTVYGETDALVRDNCVIFMDFDKDRITSVGVPDDAVMIENFGQGGNPAIAYQRGTEFGIHIAELQRQKGQYRFIEGYNKMHWNLDAISTANMVDLFGVHVVNEGDVPTRYVYCTRFSHIDTYYDIVCNVRKEPVDTSGMRIYENVGGTHRLLKEDTVETMGQDEMWYVDVSADGKYAIGANNSILVTDGSVECSIRLAENDYLNAVRWLDNDTVLLMKTDRFASADPLSMTSKLYLWNIDETNITPVCDQEGNTFSLEHYIFEDLAIDNDGTLAAMLYTEFEGRMQIGIFKIDTGEFYSFNASQYCQNDQDYDIYYGKTDDGVVYDDPQSGIDTTLHWVEQD